MIRGRHIAAKSTPYEARRPGASKTLLIIGDSTGVGTGAARPQESIAGRIAEEFKDVNIINLSRNGAIQDARKLGVSDNIIKDVSVKAGQFLADKVCPATKE